MLHSPAMEALSIDRIRRAVRVMLGGLVSARPRPRMRKCCTCGHLVQYPLFYCTECPGRYSEPITWLVRLRMLSAEDHQSPCNWRVFADVLFAEMGLRPECSPRRDKLAALAIKICQEQVAINN